MKELEGHYISAEFVGEFIDDAVTGKVERVWGDYIAVRVFSETAVVDNVEYGLSGLARGDPDYKHFITNTSNIKVFPLRAIRKFTILRANDTDPLLLGNPQNLKTGTMDDLK